VHALQPQVLQQAYDVRRHIGDRVRSLRPAALPRIARIEQDEPVRPIEALRHPSPKPMVARQPGMQQKRRPVPPPPLLVEQADTIDRGVRHARIVGRNRRAGQVKGHRPSNYGVRQCTRVPTWAEL
jgi:hypothetical protein